MKCTYLIGRDQPCRQETNEGQHCSHHAARRRVSCHSPDTHNCTHQKNSICGNALCGECEHVELPDGANGMFYQRAKPGVEPVIPHYGKEAMKGK